MIVNLFYLIKEHGMIVVIRSLLIICLVIICNSLFGQITKKVKIINGKVYGELTCFDGPKKIKSINFKKNIEANSIDNWLKIYISPDSVSTSDKLYKNNKSGESQKNLDNINKMPRDSVFYLLDCMLSFKIDSIEYCIIKGKYKFENQKLQNNSLVFEKVKGNWYLTSAKSNWMYYNVLFMAFSTNSIEDILLKKDSDNLFLSELISKSKVEDYVDIDKFFSLINPLLDSKDSRLKDLMEPLMFR